MLLPSRVERLAGQSSGRGFLHSDRASLVDAAVTVSSLISSRPRLATLRTMSAERRLATLLTDRGAQNLEHPGGSLFAHLERVQHRLAVYGASSVLQLAGRAHAVYETDGFDTSLLDLSERPMLAEVIGADAEHLVYLYAACDRRRTWRTLPEDRQVWDRFTGVAHELEDERVRAFADLSLVNELDIAEHSTAFVAQHGAYFRGLADSWRAVLSPEVGEDAKRTFGTAAPDRVPRFLT